MSKKGLHISHTHKRGKTRRSKLYRALGSGTKRKRKASDMLPGKGYC